VALRERLGVRNVAHTLVKLVRPVAGPNLLLTSITHPEFAQLYGELFALTGEAAICLRGTEGESVVRPQRAQPLQWWADGASREIPMPQEGPETMPGPQFEATLAYTRAVLDGALAAPPSLLAQRDAILAAWHAPGG
jgi:anthranilate phosphoribosyltransferase